MLTHMYFTVTGPPYFEFFESLIALVPERPVLQVKAVQNVWGLCDIHAAHFLLMQGLLACFQNLNGLSISFKSMFMKECFEPMFLKHVGETMMMITSQLALLQEVTIGCLADDVTMSQKIEKVV